MPLNANFKDKDLGWKNLKKELKKIDGSFTKVGIQAGTERMPGRDEKKGKKIPTMFEVAASNEFGTDVIPARPFVSTSFDENKEKIKEVTDKEYQKILAKKSTVNLSLAKIGEWFTAVIKKKITDIKMPPNAPRTIRKKKSSNPLIDTGQMRASITHIEVIKSE